MRHIESPERQLETARRISPYRMVLSLLAMVLAVGACTAPTDETRPAIEPSGAVIDAVPTTSVETPDATIPTTVAGQNEPPPTSITMPAPPASTTKAVAVDPGGETAETPPVNLPDLDDLDALLADLNTAIADLDASPTQQEGDIFDE